MAVMRRICYTLLAMVLFATGCNKEDMTFAQHEQIVKYLTSTLGLIAEEELGGVIESQPKFYSTFDRYTYRYVVSYYDEGRDERAKVRQGSTVEFHFDAYVIKDGRPTTIYWSNTQSTYDEFRKENPNFTVDWSLEPLRVKVGTTSMLRGLELALPGCREKDSVQVFMTYNMADGKNIVGQVPKNSAVAWYMKIDKVENE
jgi:hypothetical protein